MAYQQPERDRCLEPRRRIMAMAGAGVAAEETDIELFGFDGSIIGTVKPYETNDPRKKIINDYLIEYSSKLLNKFGDELNNQSPADSTATAMVDAMLAARIPIMAEKFCESVNTDYEHIPTEEYIRRPDIEVLFEEYVKLTEALSSDNTPEKEKIGLRKFKTQLMYKLDKEIHEFLKIAYSKDVFQEAKRLLGQAIKQSIEVATEKADNN
jgi:hypothetical protein